MPTTLNNIVDLHGLSVEGAQAVVDYWLSTATSQSIHKLRFVTGRGNHVNAKGERGTLFQLFPSWIKQAIHQDKIATCKQHDGFFEITLKVSKPAKPVTDFFKTSIDTLLESNIGFIKEQADAGEVYFQFLYGQLLEDGQGIDQNFKQAAIFYQHAADKNYTPALHELARCYFHGVGVRQNPIKAVDYLKQADHLGFLESTVSLGDSYWLGNGVDEDNKIAVSYYAKAAKQGHATAMQYLGRAYSQGYGVDKNVQQAFNWYRKAANKGDAIAQYNVGIMYQRGLGTEINLEEAFRYLLMGAESGDPDAQCSVGIAYLAGDGVTQDVAQANTWLEHASANGSKQAAYALNQLKQQEGEKTHEKYLKKSADAGNFVDTMRYALQTQTLNLEQQDELFLQEFKKGARQPLEEIIKMDRDSRFWILDWMLMQGKLPDKKKAFKALEMMADEGCILSLRRLASLHESGFPSLRIKKDVNQQIAFLEQAIHLNDSKSMVSLAGIYEDRNTRGSLEQKILALYEKAVSLQNPQACHLMGIHYADQATSPEQVDQAMQYLAAARVYESRKPILENLRTGILDEYRMIGKEAAALFEELKRKSLSYSSPQNGR